LRIWEPLIIGLAAAIGLIAGYNINFDNQENSLLSIQEDSEQGLTSLGDGRIEEILRFVESRYVDTIDTDNLSLALIDDMLGKLDPHSSYISAEELKDHDSRMRGVYYGIGIQTVELRDTFYVSRVLEGSPAQNAGLTVGDAILKIDDYETKGKPILEVTSLLGDTSVTEFVLEVKSIGERGTKEVGIKAEEIILTSANVCYMLNDDTAYLKLSRFSGNTYEQFIESIEKIKSGLKQLNLVIDLRDNPGGDLQETIKVLSQLFEDKDKLLTYTVGLNRKRRDYRSTGNAFYRIGKVAVLVDEYSASGSEILAGAIQDWDRGLVIGETTYGKGLVQEIFPLKNGGALRLTVAKYYTPSGRLIQKSYASEVNGFFADTSVHLTKMLEREMDSGQGIIPDIQVETKDDCYKYGYYYEQFILDRMLLAGNVELTKDQLTTKSFDKYIGKYYPNEIDEINRGLCSSSDFIWAIYQRMNKSKVDFARYQNASDECVYEAMKFISDNKTTVALLSEEG